MVTTSALQTICQHNEKGGAAPTHLLLVNSVGSDEYTV